MACLSLVPQGALSALCLVGLQLLHTKVSDWSLWNAGKPGRSYCSLGEPWGAAATAWNRAGLSSTMAGMSVCTLWGRKAETAIFSSCVAQPFLCQCDGLGGSRPQLWNAPGHAVLHGDSRDKVSRSPEMEGECASRAQPCSVVLLSVDSSCAPVVTDPHACPQATCLQETPRTGRKAPSAVGWVCKARS